MREFIDVTGKTEDEALSKALEQLGLERDDVSVEIFGARQVRLPGPWRLSRQGAGELRPGGGRGDSRPAPAPKEKPQEERPKPPKAEKPPRQERKSAEAPAPAPEEDRQSAPVQTLGEEVDD